MKKMTLDLDALSVESFDTETLDAAGRGTVQGHVCTGGASCRCQTAYAVCTAPKTYSCEYTQMTVCDSWCTEDV